MSLNNIAILIACGLLLFAISSCRQEIHVTESYTIPPQPEISTGYSEKPGWATNEFAVATANPLATDAGYQIIQAGGSAADAAIAVQWVLSLTEPQSSGIGGGAFILVWENGHLHAYNGRETAPQAAGGDLFLDENGEALPFRDAVRSGKSVGVPGTVAVLKTLHDHHGTLPWKELFVPAITLAREGFHVSSRLTRILAADEDLRRDPVAGPYYYNENGEPHSAGYLLKNPAYARILENIASEGIEAFYKSEVAADIVRRVRSHPRPGTMAERDLEEYMSLDLITKPICTDYKEYTICGFPPPSSGHLTMMQILGILEQMDLEIDLTVEGVPGADWLHNWLEASKLAYADRARYIADPDFTEAPGGEWQKLLAPGYLSSRAALIGERSMGEAEAGLPGQISALYGIHPYQPEAGTSHISIIDREGNAISMTTTIESGFGNRTMSDGGTGLTGGFHLNNELTDFSLTPSDEHGSLIANRVEPGKRPRSSMTPTIIFHKGSGELHSVVGSPGGAAIIHYVGKAITGMLDWHLDAQKALDLPNLVNYNGPSILEEGYFSVDLIRDLERRGHIIRTGSLTSGLHAIQVLEDGTLYGGADPRREGNVMGE